MYCVYLKKKIVYTSNGGGQMIVWPPEFPVWGGPWPLGPPLATPLQGILYYRPISRPLLQAYIQPKLEADFFPRKLLPLNNKIDIVT